MISSINVFTREKLQNYYITTPIYYVNDVPHIGHAYTSLACDILARFKRLDGYDVKFLTGTDEHGQKVEKSAIKALAAPQIFTDRVSENFRELTKLMNFSNDDFIRTTEPRHKMSVTRFWEKIAENGYIYEDKYAGWYSVRDEAFYAESELVDGKAPTGAEVEWVEEPSYFFKLSNFQDRLLELYENHPEFIFPNARKNEVVSFVKSGLKDLSISRTSFKWGIQVPGDAKHVIYVWLDALTNYISALGYPNDISEYWPAIHVVGKDILRFHAIYWPAFLMAADLPVPRQIIAHGWWTNEGQKISKSLGNVIDPVKMVEEFGLDQTRYFLMRAVPFGGDGNYSRDNMIAMINAELANNIGNLCQRTMTFIHKNCGGEIKSFADIHPLGVEKIQIVKNHIENYRFHLALEEIISISNLGNEFIDKAAPWNLKKDGKQEEMEKVLYQLTETIRIVANLLLPFMPESAAKILHILNIQEADINISGKNRSANIPAIIFPRIQL